MQAPADPNIATCPDCGALLDVSGEQIFSLINCSSCGAQMRVRCDFANYEIHGILGVGGQGIAYRAIDKKLNRPVAIKVMKRELSADPNFVKRFEGEARITASLNHPNIVKVFSFGEHEGLVYLVMEVVDHGSLESLMIATARVPEDRVLEVGIQIAQGLKAGLALGLIHRDIKPGNILFADEHTAKIVDFGLAILVKKQHEELGDIWATPFYVSPEKLDGRAEDFRSDMYSLAATLFHALAGRPPFISETNSVAELQRIKSRPVHLHNFAPHVSTPTAYTIDRALSVAPEDRFPNYDGFIQNLEYAREELRKRPLPARTTRVLQPAAPARSGSWPTVAAVAAVVGIGLFFWMNRERTDPANARSHPSTPTPAPAFSSADARYESGRQQLAGGMYLEAVTTFRGLCNEGGLHEPKNSWAAVHLGLAEYCAGHGEKARPVFEKLPERIVPGTIGLDARLVLFLNRVAEIGSGRTRLTPVSLGEFDTTTYEALAILVGAVREWDAGAYDDAAKLFRNFQNTLPSGDSAWVANYRPMAVQYLDDYGNYREISDAIRNMEAAPEAAEAALGRLPDAKSRIRSPGLRGKLMELEADFAGRIAAAAVASREATARKRAEAEALEAKVLRNAKLAAKSLCENYRFAEALALIRAVDVRRDQAMAERELLARRIDWLVRFKRRLIEDINSAGCTLPIQRKSGQQILGGIARASETQLDFRVQFGSLPVSWSDVSAQSVLQMAKFYLKASPAAPTVADRQWLAGVFCLFSQLSSEGWSLIDEAASGNGEYRTQAAALFGRPASVAPRPPVEEPPDEEMATGLETIDQPLNPSRKDQIPDIIKGIPPRNGP